MVHKYLGFYPPEGMSLGQQKRRVLDGNYKMTRTGLTQNDIVVNARGKAVSKSRHDIGNRVQSLFPYYKNDGFMMHKGRFGDKDAQRRRDGPATPIKNPSRYRSELAKDPTSVVNLFGAPRNHTRNHTRRNPRRNTRPRVTRNRQRTPYPNQKRVKRTPNPTTSTKRTPNFLKRMINQFNL